MNDSGRESDYKKITTEDGSYTIFSPLYNEACHSMSGAKSETKQIYIEGCEVLKKGKDKKDLYILEIGFGAGLGFIETSKFLQENNCCCNLHFVSLEIDPVMVDLFEKSNKIKFNLENTENFLIKRHQNQNHNLSVIIKDARDTLTYIKQAIPDSFDIIYMDAFSPKNNPDLWTVEWFLELKKVSNPQTIMTTYCAATHARKSMHEAGWFVNRMKAFGNKKEATKATLSGETAADILSQFLRSTSTARHD